MIQPGNEFTVHIQRGERRLALELRPVAIPHRILAQWIGGHLLEKYAADLVDAEP